MVLYGGFLWDLKHEHERFCNLKKSMSRNDNDLLRIYCRNSPTRNSTKVSVNSNPITIIEYWNNLILPWCSNEIFQEWKYYYIKVVDTILSMFPTARLALRTQPISSGIFLGNKHCHEPNNIFIRFLGSLTGHQFMKMRKLYDLHESYSGNISMISDSSLFRLIDVASLFISPPDSNSMYSLDKIHLSSFGFGYYRAYFLKVIMQHIEESSDVKCDHKSKISK